MPTPNELADTLLAKATTLRTTADQLTATAAQVRLITPAPPAPPAPPAWTARFPGDTKPGTIRLGSAYGSNTEPGNRYGATPGVRRTFVPDWSKRSSLIAIAKADHAVGRLPWVSTKVNVPAIAQGTMSILVELDAFIVALRDLRKPVILGVSHEPEDNVIKSKEFTAAQWCTVQVRVREAIVKAGAKNICFATPLMSWTWNAGSGRNPADYWPGLGVWDALAVDAYQKTESGVAVPLMKEWTALTAFAKAKGLPVIVGEWGQRGTDTAKLSAAYDEFIAQGVPVVAWFDTELNGGYPLSGAMLAEFSELVKDQRSVDLIDQP